MRFQIVPGKAERSTIFCDEARNAVRTVEAKRCAYSTRYAACFSTRKPQEPCQSIVCAETTQHGAIWGSAALTGDFRQKIYPPNTRPDIFQTQPKLKGRDDMSDKTKSKPLSFPLKETTHIQIRAIDEKSVWLSPVDDRDNSLFIDVVQFQKAVKDEHGCFYYSKNRHLENSIAEWLPDGYYCQEGEVYENGYTETMATNYWPLIVFLILMFGGLLM